jgi:HlyD family secretion protein
MNRMAAALAALVALASCGPAQPEGWLGYVEADFVMVAPPQPGWVMTMNVERGSAVKAGDVLFTLDTTAQLAARDNADSQLETARAAVVQMKADVEQTAKALERQRALVRIGATARATVEQAQAAYEGAVSRLSQQTAQVDAMRASLASAEYNLEQRTVRSKVAGRVQDIFFRPGEYAAAGAAIVSLLPPNYTYVRFFIPEGDVRRASLGETVHVGCDGCAAGLSAKITFIASDVEYTPPIIYSVENRSKLVFKAEARGPAIGNLRPGLPVNVTLAH